MRTPGSSQENACEAFELRLQLLLDNRGPLETLLNDPHARKCDQCRQSVVAMQFVAACGSLVSDGNVARAEDPAAPHQCSHPCRESGDSQRRRSWIGWSTALSLCFILLGMQGMFQMPSRMRQPLNSMPNSISRSGAVATVADSRRKPAPRLGTRMALLRPGLGAVVAGPKSVRTSDASHELMDRLLAGPFPVVNAMLSSGKDRDPEVLQLPVLLTSGFGTTGTEFPSTANLAASFSPQVDQLREELASNFALRCGVRCVALVPGIVVLKTPVQLSVEFLLDSGFHSPEVEKSNPLDQSLRLRSMPSLNALA